jgi:hypothetical protein
MIVYFSSSMPHLHARVVIQLLVSIIIHFNKTALKILVDGIEALAA